jgi:hypothetical protein
MHVESHLSLMLLVYQNLLDTNEIAITSVAFMAMNKQQYFHHCSFQKLPVLMRHHLLFFSYFILCIIEPLFQWNIKAGDDRYFFLRDDPYFFSEKKCSYRQLESQVPRSSKSRSNRERWSLRPCIWPLVAIAIDGGMRNCNSVCLRSPVAATAFACACSCWQVAYILNAVAIKNTPNTNQSYKEETRHKNPQSEKLKESNFYRQENYTSNAYQ